MLRNADRGVKFSGKKRYEGIMFNIISVTRKKALRRYTVQQSKPHVRDIGIVLDDTMTMAKHVSHTCRTAYYHLHNIAGIRRSLTTSACKIIVHSLVISRLDFGNATLYGISDALLHRLQVLQNSAARLITGTRRREHISPVLFALHWLPIRQRIKF